MTSKRAQNAAMKGRLDGVIQLGKLDNPVFYGNLEEQLRHLLQTEVKTELEAEQRFKDLSTLLDESQKEEEKRKALGLDTGFEFAVYGELKQIIDDQSLCVKTSLGIYEKILPLTQYVDWTNPEKIAIRKDMERILYEILSENFPEDKIDTLTEKIIDLAKRHLNEK